MGKDSFWDAPEKATSLLRERTDVASAIETYHGLVASLSDGQVLLELGREEKDEESLAEAEREFNRIDEAVRRLTLSRMLSGPDDARDAIVAVNAGAGGTDAQDWAEMLLRMYLRWAERKGYATEVIDLQPGDEAGIKSATLTVAGQNAYGYLKLEEGVHRLVRISPFNAAAKRQTSFASVAVYPEVEKEIEVDIEEKDLRIDVFRASGSGGQHVNKTSSAVRIVHLPTGIVVSCQQEKSQHRNRDLAMKVLRARLYQREKEKKDKLMQDVYDSRDDIAWGNQIRSYVLHPYQMAKDHRTKLENGNVQAVLDGDLDPFMEAVLMAGLSETR